jgi:aspartate kinase
MALIVQKYGGSSVADVTRIKSVANRVTSTVEEGNQVVVVVSAMGTTTDDLIKLALQITEEPDEREMDVLLSTGETVSSTLLAMALRTRGYKAISLSGAQAGIQTDASHKRARILIVDPQRVLKELEEGSIVIIAGFQGISEGEDITTLGRGGSDTTAVAMAVSLGAEMCQIYTDVEGVYTADPHLVPEAQKLKEVGYEEMLEMATHGANVIHPRAVELGELHHIPILVTSSFVEDPGTIIHGGVSMEVQEVRNKVRGIAYDLNVAKITVVGVPDRPGIASTIFESLARAGVSIDTIVQNTSTAGITDLTFTTARSELSTAMRIVEPVAKSIGAREYTSNPRLGKVSIIGTGMQNTPGYAATMFKTLANEGINIELITTSEIRITCIIEEGKVASAVRALHKAFELEQAQD